MALHFELVTPARLVRSEQVTMVVIPGTEGEAGIMENHAPLMTTMKDKGVLKIYRSADPTPEELHISGGFAEVSASGLTVLAENVA